MARRGADRELEVGSAAHYEDPALYARTYARRADDVRFYVERARGAGTVLEYGCGSGRITLPIARAGAAVTGVDLSTEMLADLRARLAKEPAEVRGRVRVLRGDMRKKAVPGPRFPLVLCTFNTFLHLYTRDDVEQFLARVRAHLSPRGRFVFDVSLPSPVDLARDPSRAYRLPDVRHPDGRRFRYRERFDYEPLRQVMFVAMEHEPIDGGEPFVTPLAHRQFFPAELEALLHYNGFAIEALTADFAEIPADRHADTLVYTCAPRR